MKIYENIADGDNQMDHFGTGSGDVVWVQSGSDFEAKLADISKNIVGLTDDYLFLTKIYFPSQRWNISKLFNDQSKESLLNVPEKQSRNKLFTKTLDRLLEIGLTDIEATPTKHDSIYFSFTTAIGYDGSVELFLLNSGNESSELTFTLFNGDKLIATNYGEIDTCLEYLQNEITFLKSYDYSLRKKPSTLIEEENYSNSSTPSYFDIRQPRFAPA